jgi:hypothetical protein
MVWKDTVLVQAGETVDILLDATNVGRWMAQCAARRASAADRPHALSALVSCEHQQHSGSTPAPRATPTASARSPAISARWSRRVAGHGRLGGLAELVSALSGSRLSDQQGGTQVMLMGFHMTVRVVLRMPPRSRSVIERGTGAENTAIDLAR